jgi:phosphopantetheine adenylyltransferase
LYTIESICSKQQKQKVAGLAANKRKEQGTKKMSITVVIYVKQQCIYKYIPIEREELS